MKAHKKKEKTIKSMVELVSTTFADAKSMRSGYTDVGISFDPNMSVSAAAAKLSQRGEIESRERLLGADVDASDLVVPADPEMDEWKEVMEIPTIKSKGRNVFLAPFERAYWQRLIARYGSDYKAMSRDIKLNNYQHTELVCKKKCAIFLEKYNDDLSRKTPAPRRKELKKAANRAARLAREEEAAKNSDSEEDVEEESGSEVEELIEEEEEEEVSSDEEEFAPPPKKRASMAPASRKSVKTK